MHPAVQRALEQGTPECTFSGRAGEVLKHWADHLLVPRSEMLAKMDYVFGRAAARPLTENGLNELLAEKQTLSIRFMDAIRHEAKKLGISWDDAVQIAAVYFTALQKRFVIDRPLTDEQQKAAWQAINNPEKRAAQKELDAHKAEMKKEHRNAEGLFVLGPQPGKLEALDHE